MKFQIIMYCLTFFISSCGYFTKTASSGRVQKKESKEQPAADNAELFLDTDNFATENFFVLSKNIRNRDPAAYTMYLKYATGKFCELYSYQQWLNLGGPIGRPASPGSQIPPTLQLNEGNSTDLCAISIFAVKRPRSSTVKYYKKEGTNQFCEITPAGLTHFGLSPTDFVAGINIPAGKIRIFPFIPRTLIPMQPFLCIVPSRLQAKLPSGTTAFNTAKPTGISLKLVNSASNKCLETGGGSTGVEFAGAFNQWGCVGVTKFKFSKYGNKEFDVMKNQTWKFFQTNEPNFYIIKNETTDKCLDIRHRVNNAVVSQLDNMALLAQGNCQGNDDNQKFEIVVAENAKSNPTGVDFNVPIMLKNKRSQKCVYVTEYKSDKKTRVGSLADGAAVGQNTCEQYPNRIWLARGIKDHEEKIAKRLLELANSTVVDELQRNVWDTPQWQAQSLQKMIEEDLKSNFNYHWNDEKRKFDEANKKKNPKPVFTKADFRIRATQTFQYGQVLRLFDDTYVLPRMYWGMGNEGASQGFIDNYVDPGHLVGYKEMLVRNFAYKYGPQSATTILQDHLIRLCRDTYQDLYMLTDDQLLNGYIASDGKKRSGCAQDLKGLGSKENLSNYRNMLAWNLRMNLGEHIKQMKRLHLTFFGHMNMTESFINEWKDQYVGCEQMFKIQCGRTPQNSLCTLTPKSFCERSIQQFNSFMNSNN